MKIAVPNDNGHVFQHFGKTTEFLIFNIENGEIVSTDIIRPDCGGHGALPLFLFSHGVDAVICGNLGEPMRDRIISYGIKLTIGVQGNAEQAVMSYLNGTLEGNPNAVHGGCGHRH